MPTTYRYPNLASSSSNAYLLEAARPPVTPVQAAQRSGPIWPHGVYRAGASATINAPSTVVRDIDTLGWAAIEALETRMRLASFAEDWDAPGMDAYDDL